MWDGRFGLVQPFVHRIAGFLNLSTQLSDCRPLSQDGWVFFSALTRNCQSALKPFN
jgi:hypothetical protein